MQAEEEEKRPHFYKARKAYKKLLKWKLKQFKQKMLLKMETLDNHHQIQQYSKTPLGRPPFKQKEVAGN